MSDPSKLTAWERWELASFDAAERPAPPPQAEEPPPPEPEAVVPEPVLKWPTAGEIEQIFQQARDDGYKKGLEDGQEAGRAAGYEAGRAEARQEAERLAAVAAQLDQALADMEPKVADELLALAVELARAVVRQEIGARPETLLQVVREALGQLPHQHVAIFLHPDDASLLRSYLGDQLSHAGHRIHEDFKLKRGDCILEAGGSQVDATVAMRWRRVLEGLGIESAWQPAATVPSPQGGPGGTVPPAPISSPADES